MERPRQAAVFTTNGGTSPRAVFTTDGVTAHLVELVQRVVGDVYLLEHTPITLLHVSADFESRKTRHPFSCLCHLHLHDIQRMACERSFDINLVMIEGYQIFDLVLDS